MPADDVFDDGETEPRAAHFAGARGVYPVEALGKPGDMFCRNPRALVRHGHFEVLHLFIPAG